MTQIESRESREGLVFSVFIYTREFIFHNFSSTSFDQTDSNQFYSGHFRISVYFTQNSQEYSLHVNFNYLYLFFHPFDTNLNKIYCFETLQIKYDLSECIK